MAVPGSALVEIKIRWIGCSGVLACGDMDEAAVLEEGTVLMRKKNWWDPGRIGRDAFPEDLRPRPVRQPCS